MSTTTLPPRARLSAALLGPVLLLAGCSQDLGPGGPQAAAPETATVQEATGAQPAPFAGDEPVRVALVQNSGAGDYFQQWTNGARQQAAALGIELQVYDAQADNARQATDMQTAIGSGVQAIIVDHGQSDTMCPLINDGLAAGLPVVIYDVEISACAPDAVETAQDDANLASLILGKMTEDLGQGKPVGYVNVLGIAPLDRRHAVWEQIRQQNGWDQRFFVGEFTNSVATDNAQLVDAALKASPGIAGIFAPYDELTKGTVSAVRQNGREGEIKVYGVDISTADIEVMTAEGSPWVATATTDPNAIGAAVVRATALELAGQLGTKEVVFPGTLVTQDFLREKQVRNLAQLREQLPELNMTQVATADWIPVVEF
ncbi:monosaccharide ABC transporter substrate-binding protein (CUT2 family) [Pseudonocardia hierapolitana]|uniref:Monosaccharide ABC transporter substrate-binding protein (CUT2 family) n=1 Tax=Pseudonocardia hierapolitana TaxID=1128676 RepID=A0A561SJJ6_9PSEU|nr:substrate-binding domain-containing protein [Pseudonocardia hierapolitana]TWF75004.1 monosaccharide ABC transporter substrate-binding protein (CUT2 family) [Pseudonocardia hierapolitana]